MRGWSLPGTSLRIAAVDGVRITGSCSEEVDELR